MRIRHSVTSFFSALLVPAVCLATIGYFGWSLVDGPRGLKELGAVQARLQIRTARLDDLRARRERLQHRVHLLEDGSIDPDLVEEVARTQLMESSGSEVAVPRDGK